MRLDDFNLPHRTELKPIWFYRVKLSVFHTLYCTIISFSLYDIKIRLQYRWNMCVGKLTRGKLYTVDAAKKYLFCTSFLLNRQCHNDHSFTQSQLSKYAVPIKSLKLRMSYSSKFYTWALCFCVISLLNLEIFRIRSFFAESTLFFKCFKRLKVASIIFLAVIVLTNHANSQRLQTVQPFQIQLQFACCKN